MNVRNEHVVHLERISWKLPEIEDELLLPTSCSEANLCDLGVYVDRAIKILRHYSQSTESLQRLDDAVLDRRSENISIRIDDARKEINTAIVLIQAKSQP